MNEPDIELKMHEEGTIGKKMGYQLLKRPDWLPDSSARQCRFHHLLCLLSAEPLYYAAMFIMGGGTDTTHRLICPTQWCIS